MGVWTQREGERHTDLKAYTNAIHTEYNLYMIVDYWIQERVRTSHFYIKPLKKKPLEVFRENMQERLPECLFR